MPLPSPLPPAVLALALVLAGLSLAGCGRYVNPDIADPAQARAQLAEDKALCQSLANQAVPPTYGMERYETDPTVEAQAGRYVANVLEDDANADAFTRCLRDRGWRYKK
jgi:hypothetical protein